MLQEKTHTKSFKFDTSTEKTECTVLSRNSGSRNSGFSHNSGQNRNDGIFIK